MLLATVPLEVKSVADGLIFNIGIAHSGECGDYDNNQSGLVAWDNGLENLVESTTDVLGAVLEALSLSVSREMFLDMFVDGQIKANDFNTYRCNFINAFFGGSLVLTL